MPIARLLPTTLAAVLLTAAIAHAVGTPTTTTITAPGAGVLGPLTEDGLGHSYFTVSGTSDGTGGTVDVYCYYLDEHASPVRAAVATSVPVGSNGAFTTATADAGPASDNPCTMLAVAHNANPSDLSPFHGPRVKAITVSDKKQAGGPNDGKQYDYYDSASLGRGWFDFESAGSCGVDYSRPFLAAPASGLQQFGPHVFDCTGFFPPNEQTAAGVYRSAVKIDGHNALPTANAYALDNNGAWAGITHSATFDPVTGRFTITEDDHLVECQTDPGTSSMTMANCSPYVADGVALHRVQIIEHDGLVVWQTDTFSSSTGQHALDLSTDESYSPAAHVQQFPGEGALTAHHTAFGTVAIASSGHPESILDEYNPALSDGDVGNPRSSTTMWPVPDQALFRGTAGDEYYLHYALTIPATGSLTITRVYSQEFKAADLAALTSEAQDKLEAPTLSLTAPADGTTVSVPTVTVTGNATDNGGAPTVTVNGQAATVSSGTFSKDVALNAGPNTITVVATDATGNQVTATRAITYTPPAPPPTPPSIANNGTVSCPAGGAPCQAAATWTSRQAFAAAATKNRHKVVLARWSRTIAAGKRARATPTLTAVGRRLLRKRSVAAVRVTSARASTGTPVAASAKVTLHRLPKKKHKH